MAVNGMKKYKAELIFIPGTGTGHLRSALEFAKLLIKCDNNLHITVLCFKFPYTPSSDSYIKSVLASQPEIQLIDLPEVEPRPIEELFKSPEHYILTFIESLIPHVKATISRTLHINLHRDQQPDSSVVFLCFGSMGSFGPSQTREIAIALQGSGVRFLWAMRTFPATNNANKALPEGFLECIDGRGMICEWAPQVEVLAHKAVGGFVSHCGWNSILESLWFGVPILTWPINAEQQLNAFWMVREWGLGLELRLSYRNGSDLVVAEEIEKGLKQLMEERDNKVLKKVRDIKEVARKAVLDSGSSFISVRKLIDNMQGRN